MLVLIYCTSSVITDTTQCFEFVLNVYGLLRESTKQNSPLPICSSYLFPLEIRLWELENWNNPIEGWITPIQVQPWESRTLTAFLLRPLVDYGLDALSRRFQHKRGVQLCRGGDWTLRSHTHYHVLCHWATFQLYFFSGCVCVLGGYLLTYFDFSRQGLCVTLVVLDLAL